MVWAIVVVAIAVLGVAAWVGTGRLGEMPEAVNDRPKAHIPARDLDQSFLDEMALPRAVTGYRRRQVDDFLAAQVAGAIPEVDPSFDVVRGGYDMQAVDAVLDRMRRPEPAEADTSTGSRVLDGGQEADAGTDLAASDTAGGGGAAPEADVEALPLGADTPETQDFLHDKGADEGAKGELRAP